ncbi:hypothetical protein [Streptomyces sp. NPDC058989]|uniref:hypothetical protein n=1 Tax=Streptomyces sp. NPDC058989 TaxID=3346686 RepID=UPI0036A37523
MERHGKLLERLQEAKWGVLEIIVLATALAFSIGVFSSLAMEWLSNRSVAIVSLACALICLIYIALRHTRDRKLTANIDSVFIIDGDNKMVAIADYDASQDVAGYFEGAFAENPALRRQWEREPLESMHQRVEGRNYVRSVASTKLIREVYEYAVLEDLTTHLTGYFNGYAGRDEDLRTYERNDLPDVLLANRFLELFSRDMADRDAFRSDDEPSDGGRVIMQTGPGGYFHRFELTLPKGSVLKREGNSTLVISGPAFQMKISVQFRGMGSNVPLDHIMHYVGVDPLEVRDFNVRIVVQVLVRRSFIFGGRRWNDHMWVDSLVESLVERFSLERHLVRINWPALAAMLHCLDVRDRRTNSPSF